MIRSKYNYTLKSSIGARKGFSDMRISVFKWLLRQVLLIILVINYRIYYYSKFLSIFQGSYDFLIEKYY